MLSSLKYFDKYEVTKEYLPILEFRANMEAIPIYLRYPIAQQYVNEILQQIPPDKPELFSNYKCILETELSYHRVNLILLGITEEMSFELLRRVDKQKIVISNNSNDQIYKLLEAIKKEHLYHGVKNANSFNIYWQNKKKSSLVELIVALMAVDELKYNKPQNVIDSFSYFFDIDLKNFYALQEGLATRKKETIFLDKLKESYLRAIVKVK